MLDRAVHAVLDVGERLDGTAHEELVVVGIGLVVEIRRRRVETVGIAVVLVLASEEVGAVHEVEAVVGVVGVGVLLRSAEVAG